MSNTDKLQEIKQRWDEGMGLVTASSVDWLISQLEQAQIKCNNMAHKLAKVQSELTKMTISNDSLLEQVEQSQTELLKWYEQARKLEAENEQLKADKKKLAEIIARNLTAWDTSKDKRTGLLPEVYWSNRVWYEKLTGEEYIFARAVKQFHIGEV